MRFRLCSVVLVILVGSPFTQSRADDPGPTTRPTSDEIVRRISAVKSIIDACQSEAGSGGEPLVDYAASTLDSIIKAQKRDYPGAIAEVRQIPDGQQGRRGLQTLISFCLATGDIDGATQLISLSGFPATPEQYLEVATAALRFGDRSAAQSAVDAGLDTAKKNPPPPNHAFEDAQFNAAVMQLQSVMNTSASEVEIASISQLAAQAQRAGLRDQLARLKERAIQLATKTPDTDIAGLLTLGTVFVQTDDRDHATAIIRRIDDSHNALNRFEGLRLLHLRAQAGLDLDDAEILAQNNAAKAASNPRMQTAPPIELQLAEECCESGNKKEAARLAKSCVDQAVQSPAPANQTALLTLAKLIAPADQSAGLDLFNRVIDLSARLGDGRDPLPQKMPSPEMQKQAREFYSVEKFVTLINVAKAEAAAGLSVEASKRLSEGMTGLHALLPDAATTGGSRQIVNGYVAGADELAEMGQVDSAIDAYKALIAVDESTPATQRFTGLPTSSDNLLAAIAHLQLLQHRFADAAATVAKIAPQSRPWVAITIGQDMIKAGDLDTSAKIADSIPDPNPDAFGLEPIQKPQLLNALAKARLTAGDKTQAADLAKRSLKILVRFRAQNIGLSTPQPRGSYVDPEAATRPTSRSCCADAFTTLCAAEGAEQAVGSVQGELEISAAISVLCDRGQVDLARSLIDTISSASRRRENSAMPKAICLEQLAIAELNQGDRPGFDRDAITAAEMADIPGQEATYDITIPMAAALDAKGDPQGAEMLRAMAVRRMLTGGDMQQPLMLMQRLIKVEVLPARGPSSAYFLIEAAPTAKLRAKLLADLATQLVQDLIDGKPIPDVVLKKPEFKPPTSASTYKGKTIDQWAAEMIASRSYGPATQAMMHFGSAAGPTLAKIAHDHADDDQLCEQVVFALRDSGSDPRYVVELTTAKGDRTQSLAVATVEIWGVDCVQAVLDQIDKSTGKDRARLVQLLSFGAPQHRITLDPLPGVDVNPNPPNTAFVLTGKKKVSPELTKRLMDLADTNDPQIRQPALVALAGFGDESAIPSLVKLLSDSDMKARNCGCLGLARLGPQAIAALPALQNIPASDPLSNRVQWTIRRIQGIEPDPGQ